MLASMQDDGTLLAPGSDADDDDDEDPDSGGDDVAAAVRAMAARATQQEVSVRTGQLSLSQSILRVHTGVVRGKGTL